MRYFMITVWETIQLKSRQKKLFAEFIWVSGGGGSDVQTFLGNQPSLHMLDICCFCPIIHFFLCNVTTLLRKPHLRTLSFHLQGKPHSLRGCRSGAHAGLGHWHTPSLWSQWLVQRDGHRPPTKPVRLREMPILVWVTSWGRRPAPWGRRPPPWAWAWSFPRGSIASKCDLVSVFEGQPMPRGTWA